MLAQVVNVTGSAGVKHNGERVRNTSFLSHGDIVQIGSRQFRFEWVNKRKKKSAQKRTKKSSKVAAASHQPKASRNVNAVTPGMEEVCSQNVMGGSRVSSKSKEALAQETVDTPKSLNTSGGKQTPASGEIIVLVKEATEQNIVGASPVESPKSLEASTAHWASSASNVVKEDLEQETRASPSKQVNEVEEVPELETAGVSLSKCSSATNVHALADEPVRPTRGCCTRGSRKDNEEAREEKKVDHPQSTKATRAKHTQGSRKAVKVDMAQTATEATPRKTRGRRAKALETALEWADDKPDASRRTAEDHSEE
ncbi:hypothetical protein V5799_024360, partial [Amblyomma americanum]